MKKFLAVLLLITCSSFAFFLNTADAAKAKPVVTADKQYFDPSRGLYFLKGNVYVATSSRTITADEATADPTGLQVWASGNVTLKQDDLTFTGDSLVVLVSKSLAQVTGNLYFVRDGITISSDYGEFNWKTKIATFSRNVVVKKADGSTNEYNSFQYHVINDEIVSSE